ncbi:hypothetical protein [Rhizobium leguminosarum]|uniref:hypothetical protein n=1 Tax=Rhizobium leguminosarum TaxID=384 RepID=UPI0028F429D0|nr:hypothetical protein [Rhizobium leguminosarum]
MMAVTIADVSLSAEKSVRLKSQEAAIRSDHVLTVPLDAEMTPPIFSISWWSRVKPASSVDPPGYLLRETKRDYAEYRPRVDIQSGPVPANRVH